jgi:hypothetical protein
MIRSAFGVCWWFDPVGAWYVRKWQYFGRTSWRHGSAQFWRFRIAW